MGETVFLRRLSDVFFPFPGSEEGGEEEEEVDPGPPFLDLLSNQRFNAHHRLDVTNDFILPEKDELPHTTVLPQDFVLSLSYKPDPNTVLRLFSTEITLPPAANSIKSSTLILSSSVMIVYDSHYYIIEDEVSTNDTHHILVYVSNGSMRLCFDGEESQWIGLWAVKDLSLSPVHLNFSRHVLDVADRVRHLFIATGKCFRVESAIMRRVVLWDTACNFNAII